LDLIDHAVYAALWLSFALGHSALATTPARQRLQNLFGGGHRIAYNLIAAGHIGAVWAIGRFVLARDATAFALPGLVQATLWVMAAAGAAILVVAMRGYDLGRFGGLAQWRAARTGQTLAEDEGLTTAGLNRFVRHPLYLGAILVVIGLIDSPFSLATAMWATLYFVVGARLEETRLVARYDDAYRRYQRQVPFLIPWRGRVL